MHKAQILLFLWAFATCQAVVFKYQAFYPEFRTELLGLLHDNCSVPYFGYKNENVQIGNKGCYPTLNCILSHARESTKANIGSASVLLGLTPSILSLLGSNTAELSLLSSQRPLLALILSAGSPALSPIRAFTYRNPLLSLKAQPDRATLPKLTIVTSIICVCVQLLAAIAAVVNVGLVSFELGFSSIQVGACNSNYDPLTWAFVAVGLHGLGVITFQLRAKITHTNRGSLDTDPGLQQLPSDEQDPTIASETKTKTKSIRRQTGRRLADWLNAEFTPCITHTTLSLAWSQETYLFIVMSFLTSVSTICHMLYGTAIFSSLLFVGVTDAWRVIGRYMASAVVCRIIVMYELAGMREAATIEGDSSIAPEE